MASGSRESFAVDCGNFDSSNLIAAHARVVVHVARLGHAHYGMDQQVGLDLLGGAEGEFHVRAVHGIAGLEGDHTPPAQAGKFGAQFGRSQTQSAKIVVRRDLQPSKLPPTYQGLALFMA